MTIAAIYARFSSDAQRDESIEIQTRECSALIEREGWQVSEVYADYAMTGTNDDRPGFRRCLSDGEAGRYDVLVTYKSDRIARNVVVAQDFRNRLTEAGVRIVSVREGEMSDSPESFMMTAMNDVWAEYYSRNLRVLIKGGIQQNARNCKASGVRLFGYGIDADDRFIPDPEEAPIVREMFEEYRDGATFKQVADKLNGRGVKNKRGNSWTSNNVGKLLKNRAYIGEYSYAGVTVEGGMPAIVDEGLFHVVQKCIEARKGGRRVKVNDYVLSSRAVCLRCGSSINGVSGTGKSGAKYAYYKCRKGCGCSVRADKVEEAVSWALADMLGKEKNMRVIVADMMELGKSIPDMTESLLEERAHMEKRRSNLVNSIAEGVPASSVADAIAQHDARIAEIDQQVRAQKYMRKELVDEDRVRKFVEFVLERSKDEPSKGEAFYEAYVRNVYIDDECAIVLFDFSGVPSEVSLDDLHELKELSRNDHLSFVNMSENVNATSGHKSTNPLITAGQEGCSYRILWWSIGGSNP